MRGRVTGIALQDSRRHSKFFAETAGQFGFVPGDAEYAEEAELAFEDGARAGETTRSETCGEHPRLRSAPQMQPLHHAAIAACEFQQSAAQRSRDAQNVGHCTGVEAQQVPGGDRGPERPRRARSMKAA